MASSTLSERPDASEVGFHCSICRILDFLPFRCNGCGAVFCKAHQAAASHPEQHECPSPPETLLPARLEPPGSSSGSFKYLLPDRSSTKRVAEPTLEELAQQRKKQAALALLQKNFPQASTSRSNATSAPTSGARKSGLSPAVALMKLKRAAKPVDPKKKESDVPQGERRYVTVVDKTVPTGSGATVWIGKSVNCGRALDLFASYLNVRNENDKPGLPEEEKLCLSTSASDDKSTIPTLRGPISSSIGSVTSDGDEVWLLRGRPS